jgi:hypothetical protein
VLKIARAGYLQVLATYTVLRAVGDELPRVTRAAAAHCRTGRRGRSKAAVLLNLHLICTVLRRQQQPTPQRRCRKGKDLAWLVGERTTSWFREMKRDMHILDSGNQVFNFEGVAQKLEAGRCKNNGEAKRCDLAASHQFGRGCQWSCRRALTASNTTSRIRYNCVTEVTVTMWWL